MTKEPGVNYFFPSCAYAVQKTKYKNKTFNKRKPCRRPDLGRGLPSVAVLCRIPLLALVLSISLATLGSISPLTLSLYEGLTRCEGLIRAYLWPNRQHPTVTAAISATVTLLHCRPLPPNVQTLVQRHWPGGRRNSRLRPRTILVWSHWEEGSETPGR